ncbi:hypothetical protein HWC68_gp08 [Gordonia phage Gibbin]|uniref:Uncharacterized protein n=3 Tax=Lambovirus TaxID=2843412 RepID=A0A5J6TI68_9CAUD|nr:hypothetical protein HWC68_gp08 [Gordonia phage Gibbin]YP_009853962.1 hypothetical protein HWC82_gp08 [Gordonia phage Yikes]QFG10551.1 hypothetical protein PBI_GIBBIN_8 [Gordonia phage Gibbin]QGJ90998.1 hypothetical protein PBI_YIKES_8 [Gordonia phage Yikes]UVT30988.1 hypothetical protein SEA_PARVUSTARDA_7 [Gordonia phage ParvusTarda]
MARRKRKKLARKTLKSASARGRIPRDKNGKFVNASGRNKSKGANVQNLKRGGGGGGRRKASSSSRPSNKPAARKTASNKPPITGQPKKSSSKAGKPQTGKTVNKRKPMSRKKRAAIGAAIGAGTYIAATGAFHAAGKIGEHRARKAQAEYYRREDQRVGGYAAARNYAKMAYNGHSVKAGQWYRPTESKYTKPKTKRSSQRALGSGTRALAGTRARR